MRQSGSSAEIKNDQNDNLMEQDNGNLLNGAVISESEFFFHVSVIAESLNRKNAKSLIGTSFLVNKKDVAHVNINFYPSKSLTVS